MRADTLLLKQQLADALGDGGAAYWLSLAAFLRGKASKEALDESARAVLLGDYEATLHNQLLSNILLNCQPHIDPPQGENNCSFKQKQKKTNHRQKDSRITKLKRFNDRTIFSLSQQTKTALLELVILF
jgi:hypothetical protein